MRLATWVLGLETQSVTFCERAQFGSRQSPAVAVMQPQFTPPQVTWQTMAGRSSSLSTVRAVAVHAAHWGERRVLGWGGLGEPGGRCCAPHACLPLLLLHEHQRAWRLQRALGELDELEQVGEWAVSW